MSLSTENNSPTAPPLKAAGPDLADPWGCTSPVTEGRLAWCGYHGDMGAQIATGLKPLTPRLRDAPSPTDDDVAVLWDGRRIDSREV